VYRSDFVGYTDSQEREAVSETVSFRRSQIWAIAVLAVFLAFSLSSRSAWISYAADETPAADSDAEDEGQNSEEQTDSSDDENDSSETAAEEDDSKETDREVEEEPDEEEVDEPPAAGTRDDEVAEGEQGDAEPPEKEKRIIGATATVLEKQSNLLFRARVDTGAKSCSLHIEEMSIDGEEEKWVDNIGKIVRFKVKNRNGESHFLDARIDGYVIIKTSGARVRRYKVPMTLRWKGVEKTVLVTLNDRDGMEYPLLLGRNFLRGDFVVDVDVDNDD
jgi:hypothetical protein